MPHITLLSPLPGQNVSALVDTFKAKVIQVQSTGTSWPPLFPSRSHLSDLIIGTGPLEVDLRPAQRGDQYFQSVLAPVKPVSRLLNIRRACEDAYDSHPPEYFPHLSLLYGDLTPKRREELVEIIKSGQLGNLPKSVRVEEAVFVNCSGPADGWKVLERVRL